MILNKYFKKLGISEFSQLTQEEKDTYNEWEEALNGRQITDENVKDFFNVEIEETINSLIVKKLKEREDIFLKVKLEFLRNIKDFLDAPKREQAMVKKEIKSLIEKI